LEQGGLAPYVGFLHGGRPGTPALARAVMEEVRPRLAARLAFTLLPGRETTGDHFEERPPGARRRAGGGRRAGRRARAGRRRRAWPHALLKREVEAAFLPLVQARLLARHLRGDLETYQPWMVN